MKKIKYKKISNYNKQKTCPYGLTCRDINGCDFEDAVHVGSSFCEECPSFVGKHNDTTVICKRDEKEAEC